MMELYKKKGAGYAARNKGFRESEGRYKNRRQDKQNVKCQDGEYRRNRAGRADDCGFRYREGT